MGGGGAEPRSERVKDQVGAGQVARLGRLVAPGDRAVGADDHERALREPARVVDAERPAGRALGLEVRQLLDLYPELPPERRLRVRGIAGDAVERRAALLEVLQDL